MFGLQLRVTRLQLWMIRLKYLMLIEKTSVVDMEISISLEAKEFLNVMSHWVCNVLIFESFFKLVLSIEIILKKDLGPLIRVLTWIVNRLVVVLLLRGIWVVSYCLCKYFLESFLVKDSKHEGHNFKYCENTSDLWESL